MDFYNKLKGKFTSDNTRSVEEKDKDKDKEEEKGEVEPVCLLFPTYATKNFEGQLTNEWKIRIRGWAFSAPKKSKTRSIFLGLTSLALQKDDKRFQYLESRTSYFWANNADQGEFIVQVEGLTDSNKMTIEGDPNDKPLDTSDADKALDNVGTVISDKVEKVVSAASAAAEVISATTKVISATIAPKSGHFSGDLGISKDTVLTWIDEGNSTGNKGVDVVVKKDDEYKSRLLKIKVHRDGILPHYGVVNLVEPEGVSIISDIDDTIKDTNILQGAKRVLSNTFLQDFREVPAMAELYRNFYRNGAAIHYVSNSPWQLFPTLRTFFDTYNFPPGSAHFKFYDGLIKSAYEQKENPMASKFKYIRELLNDFPKRKFILIGDTGELDPEIYTTIARENPGRILRIYVRDVTTEYVKDLPPQKARHSYTQTFPKIYNYLRSYYSSEGEDESSGDKKGEGEAEAKEQAVTATLGETTGEEAIDKPDRKPSLTNRVMDKLHVDMSYLYGTTITESPGSIDDASKPKIPLSAKLLSPERAANISSRIAKFRSSSSSSSSSTSRSIDGKKDDDKKVDDKDDKDVKDVKDEKEDEKEELKTPLEMFKERCQSLRVDLPEDLFHTFTDAKEIENDPAIRKELNLKNE